MKFSLVSGLYKRFLVAMAGMIAGMILGFLLLVRWLHADPLLAALLLVPAQVILSRAILVWQGRLAADCAVVGAILSVALAGASWRTVLGVILAAPLCALLLSLVERGGRPDGTGGTGKRS